MPKPSKAKRPKTMPEPQPLPEIDREAEKVRTWRMEQFDRLGFDYPQSLELALSGADWHRAETLLGQGATHAQIVEVMV